MSADLPRARGVVVDPMNTQNASPPDPLQRISQLRASRFGVFAFPTLLSHPISCVHGMRGRRSLALDAKTIGLSQTGNFFARSFESNVSYNDLQPCGKCDLSVFLDLAETFCGDCITMVQKFEE